MAEYITVGAILAVGGFLWRQIASLDRRVAEIGRHVVDVDRRLATLEGRITGWQDHQHQPAPARAE